MAWAAILAAAPTGALWWRKGHLECSPAAAETLGLEAGPQREDAERCLVRVLTASDGQTAAEAVIHFRKAGRDFDLKAITAAGRPVRLRGQHLGDRPVVWVEDLTAAVAAARTHAAEAGSAQLHRVLDAVPVPIWWRSGDSRPPAGNAAFAAAGLDAFTSGEGLRLEARARQTGLAQSESHYALLNGERRLLEITEAPLPGLDVGQPATVGYALDLTNLESLQSELATHVAVQGELMEALGSAIAMFGADRRLRFFNNAFVDLWQIDRRLLEHGPRIDEFLEALHERRRLPELVDFQAFKQDVDAMFTELIEPREELMHLPDERTLRVVTSPHPMGGLIQICEDVTDRLALERSYNTLIAVQRESLNNLYEAITVFGGDGRLKLWNRSATKIWELHEGISPSEMHIGDILEHTRKFFPPRSDWPELKARLVLAVTEPEARSGRLERTDGTVLDFACVPLPDGACMLGYIDVTDSVHVQRALEERNQALETADRIKSEFIANVSYELRTPLNAIIGFTEILEHRYFGELSPRQGEYVAGILQASRHLMSLINDILDLATIEAGYMVLDLKPASIHDLLSGLLETFRKRASDRKLALKLECPADIGTITADERRLRQAFYNLLSNAVQFTPPGGQIAVAAAREGAELTVTVRDTGVGIAAENIDRMFDKFERADPHARESGPGLGLALVKSLIELHGGTVRIASEAGKGTSVECRLPAAASAR